MLKTLSSRAFNQDVGAAKRSAMDGPVVITDRGRPSHVLLSYQDFRDMKGPARSLAEMLYMPGIADIELDIPPRDDVERDPVDLS